MTAQANENIVVLIECTLASGSTSQGSGVLVSSNGHVLTARHVAPDKSKCTGRIGNKTLPPRDLIWPVEDRALSPDIDGRLLSFAPSADETFDYATYCPVASQPVSTPLTARGFHRVSVSRPSATTGVLSSVTMNYDGFVETDTMVGPGKSGGPVFLGDTTTIIGIVAGAQFDATGIVTNYSILAVDALFPSFPMLQEASGCAPASAPEIAKFAPSIAYFDGILQAVRASPETARKMQRETINAHRAFFDDLSAQQSQNDETAAALARARDALLRDPIDPQAIRQALADAVTHQNNADLLSGSGPSTIQADLLLLQADFEAAVLKRKEAARLYRQASALFVQTDPDTASDSLFQAGHQLYLHARDASDAAALFQSITLLEQARDLLGGSPDDRQWARTHLKLGDAYKRQARRECGLDTLQKAKSAYEDGLKKADKDADPLVWAELMIHLGEATLSNADRVKSEALMAQAIALFREVLPVLDYAIEQSAPELRATALNNLGKALRLRGARASDLSELEEAFKIFEQAISIRSRASLPYDWSETRSNQGAVLTELGRRSNTGDNLARAVLAHEESLEVRSRGLVPLRWAETRHSLAQALLFMGMRDRSETKILEAIDVLNSALEVRKIDTTPVEWAQSQVALGTAYFALGDITYDDQNLLKAQTAYERALNARFTNNLTFRECHPAHWASATNNLGNVLLRLGQSRSDITHFEQALETYMRASQEWRREKEPLEWARLQHNIGTAKFGIGQVTASPDLINDASLSFQAALEERDPAQNASEWAETAINLGATYLWKGRALADTAELEKARGMFRDVVATSGSNAAMAATANFLAGSTSLTLFEISKNAINRTEAIAHLQLAEDYYLSVGDNVQVDQIRASIDHLKQ